MEKTANDLGLNSELQKNYWNYLVIRTKECVRNRLTGRLIIDFQRGEINSIQDQVILAGSSVLDFYVQKVS